MSNRETSSEIASVAGRILAAGNPLENGQVLGVIRHEMGKLRDLPHVRTQCIGEALAVLKPYFDNMLSLAGSCLSQAEPDDGPDGPRIRTTTIVGWDKITNAIVGTLEGDYSSWLHSFSYDPEHAALAEAARGGEHTVWYNDPSFWIGGGTATAVYDNPTRAEGNGGGKMAGIARHDFTRALGLMAEHSPRHFADLISESDDAITHDVFMQYVILGDVIYG